MDDNNNFQDGIVNNAETPVTPAENAAPQASPFKPAPQAANPNPAVIYQQPGVQQVYYANPVMPVPNGYGVYAQQVRPVQPAQPVQPVQQMVPVQQVPAYPPRTSVVPVSQAAQAKKAEPQPASQGQSSGNSGNGGKKSIVMPLIFSIALGVLFIYCLTQSFYIVKLNKQINGTTAAPTESSLETDESRPEESTEPSESEEPTQTNEDGKPWFSIEGAASATDPNKKALRTTDIVAEASPATIPVYIMKGNDSSAKKVASGTGFIISKEGYIVTNAHVVEHVTKAPKQYYPTVLLPDDTEPVRVEIVGSDVQTDIAVLKVDSSRDLPCLKFGDSDKLQSGELVIAIGNALGQLDDTVTVGVVSATNREISNSGYALKVIQTDAAINNGNSGGPLINSFGEVVGITNAKIATSTSEGLGFAIPVNSVKGIIEKLINYGKVTNRPYLGISVRQYGEGEYNDGAAGIYVMGLTKGGPGEKAGIKEGDRLVSIDGVEIKSSNDIIVVRDSHKVGDSVEVVVDRNGTKQTLTMVIGDSADFQDAQTSGDDEDEGERDGDD